MSLLISIENGFSARYLLRTGILEGLLAARIPLIVATPNAHEAYFREWLEEQGVQVMPQPQSPVANSRSLRSKLELIQYYGFPQTDAGSNIEIKYRSYLQRRPMQPIFLRALELTVRAHRHSRWVRSVMTAVGKLYPLDVYHQRLSQGRVSLVVVDGIGSTGPHISNWIRAAQGYCRSVRVVTNWDHPTTKGYGSARTDHYLAWSPAMVNELVTYHDAPVERVQQVGSALFDLYARPGALLDRGQVCRQFGLDPARPIVLYASNSPVNFPHNADIAVFLADTLRQLPGQPQLLVRLHPLFLQAAAATELQRHHQLATYSGVAYSIPQVLSQTLLPDMDEKEICISASLIRAADVVVNLFSTMQLDACVCDKPIVNIGFDWHQGSCGTQQASRFHNYTHLQRMVATGAVCIAQSREELVRLIQAGLENPMAQSRQRRQVVAQECGIVDGNSVQRITEAILQQYSLTKRLPL